MKKNIIYSGFSDERRFIIDYLFKEHGWNPVFIFSAGRMRNWVKENHSHAVFHDAMQLRNARFDYAGIGKPAVPLDEKIISALSKHESYCLSLLEDTTGWNISFDQRRRYYYDLLKYWNTVIHHLKPDIYLAWTVPHIVGDYVLYQLCKYYNISVLFYNPAPLFDQSGSKYSHVSISLEDQSRVFKSVYNSDRTLELSEDLKKHFNFVRSKKGMRPVYVTYFFNNPKKHWNAWHLGKAVKEYLRLAKLFLTGRLFEKAPVSWKCNKFPFSSEKSRMNHLQLFLFKREIRRNDKRLKKIYSSFVIAPDFSKKYIYFAPPKQPEAGVWSVYKDQLLILEILSASIPEDWLIYYKEHPATFCVGDKASLARNKHYYTRISSRRGVRIIPAETDTFKLIDAAQAVAAPAGTVGWEAIVRGKPVLLFGYVWYQDCKSIFRIETYRDSVDAIEKIKKGYKPDPSDVERFAAAVLEVSEKNVIHGDWINEQFKKGKDIRSKMERMAKAIYKAYEANYLNKEKAV